MTGFHIGLDLDDVCYPWSVLIHQECVDAGITNGAVITQWGFENDYQCSREELWAVIHRAYREGILLEPPSDGVRANLTALRDADHRIHLVTARGFESDPKVAELVRQDTRTWLKEYEIPFDSLQFTKDKSKRVFDFFLDDSPANIDAVSVHPETTAFLMDQPHNQDRTDLNRVYSLGEFVQLVHVAQEVRNWPGPPELAPWAA